MSTCVNLSARLINPWLPKDERETPSKEESADFRRKILKKRTNTPADLNMAVWGYAIGWICYAIGFFTPFVSMLVASLIVLVTNSSLVSPLGKLVFNWHYPLMFVLGFLGTYFMIVGIRTGKKEQRLAAAYRDARDQGKLEEGDFVMEYPKNTDKPTNVRIIIYTVIAATLGWLLMQASI